MTLNILALNVPMKIVVLLQNILILKKVNMEMKIIL